jgi:hypothetical protein
MVAAGITRISSPLFTATLADGKSKVIVHDEGKIPPGYMRVKTTREPNKTAILAAHEDLGECVPGCEIVPTKTLRIG